MTHGREELRNVTFTAFVGPDTPLKLHAPRDYVDATDEPGRTDWILRFGWFGPALVTLHVEDPAKLWELHDLIAATLPPREQDGDA